MRISSGYTAHADAGAESCRRSRKELSEANEVGRSIGAVCARCAQVGQNGRECTTLENTFNLRFTRFT